MREEYDFSQSEKNPYCEKLPKKVNLSLEVETVEYFEKAAEEVGISLQSLIKLYLQECVQTKRKVVVPNLS